MIELLDGDQASRTERWAEDLARSLRTNPSAWSRAVEQGELNQVRAWVLLSWVSTTASTVVGSRRADLVEAATVALSLLTDGPLDHRDVLLVASLPHRAAVLAGLDFPRLATAGCRQTGALGERSMRWLPKVSPDTPSNYTEVGTGADFRFVATATKPARPPRSAYLRAAQQTAAEQPRPLPRATRYALLLGLTVLLGVGLVTLAYRQGFLPIVGTFVAVIIGPVIAVAGIRWRARKAMRRQRVLVQSLQHWLLELERERVLDPETRPTAASGESLDAAADTIAAALEQFARGYSVRAATTIAALGDQLDGWRRDAVLTRGIGTVATSARRLAKAQTRLGY